MNYNTIRRMQAYAAICLQRFCQALEVDRQEVLDLVAHLFSMLVEGDLAAWESRGGSLQLTGRGDPIPPAVLRAVPPEKHDKFQTLVESAVEVGLVDMYGEPSEEPIRFLRRCVGLLRDEGIDAPNNEALLSDAKAASGWGEVMDLERYQELQAHYGIPSVSRLHRG